ncbi:MAG: hypothetical protein HC904_04390 [Blastochloris sp.]|nr:hypothetical protein [Blastochloris sp.]
MKKKGVTTCALLCAAVFGFSAFMKTLDPATFFDSWVEMSLASGSLAYWGVWSVISLEWVLACALCFPGWRRAAAWILLVMILGFSFILFQQELHGTSVPCTCFGKASTAIEAWLPWPVRNGLLLALLLIVLAGEKSPRHSKLNIESRLKWRLRNNI